MQSLTRAQVESFWTKGFSIPDEFLDYYPSKPMLIENDTAVNSEIREQLDNDVAKQMKKIFKTGLSSKVVTSGSIDKFFSKVNSIKPIKVLTNNLLQWHGPSCATPKVSYN